MRVLRALVVVVISACLALVQAMPADATSTKEQRRRIAATLADARVTRGDNGTVVLDVTAG